MVTFGGVDTHRVTPRKEREETDASLLAERVKTDAELANREKMAEGNEDHIVEVARERAEETLGAARELADVEMAAAGVTRTFKKEVAVERAAADDIVEQERARADERLRVERQEHQDALSALLLFEREATDDGLLVERARADEVVATRDDFLAIVSHDLRNILGSIAMSASLIRRGATGEQDAATKGHAERIQRGAARMNRLVGDLLDVVSLEAGRLRVTPVPHDAVAIAKEAIESFQASFSQKGVALTTDIPASSMIVALDHDRVLQVLGNLLSNALRFTERGGHVSLALEEANSVAHFSVTDSGVGIPAGQAERIFERFGQVGIDRRGHGLGLYIAKCIVEAHDGHIWAASPDAGGAALHFTLPAAPA
jgi:signal transduction histidine kinase